MKTILSKLSNTQARKELKQQTVYAWPGVIIGYFLLSWLGVLGVFFGVRGFLLTFHAGNKGRRYLWLYRISTALASLLGAYETLWFWTHV